MYFKATMFSVPGWSVPPTQLKLQAEHAAHTKSLAQSQWVQSGEKARRKTAKMQSSTTVTANNLADLWEKYIHTSPGTNGSGTKLTKEGANNFLDQKSLPVTANAGVPASGKEHDTQADGHTFETTLKRRGLGKHGNKRQKRTKMDSSTATEASLPLQSRLSAQPRLSYGLEHADITTIPKKSISHRTSPSVEIPKITPLQNSMRHKLISARFRHINEVLYTTSSSSSAELFRTNPSFFAEYHEGFQQQVEAWPENPVLAFVSWVLTRSGETPEPEVGQTRNQRATLKKSAARSTASSSDVQSPATCDLEFTSKLDPLPRNRRSSVCTIVDLGCGSALFARSLIPKSGLLGLKIHSFDLCAHNPLITSADMSAIPLPDSSVDVAISCLALMGTNWPEFVEEAYRLLRWRGEYWIAEVASRFVAKDQTISTVNRRRKNGRIDRIAGKTNRVQNAKNDTGEDGGLLFSEDSDLPEGKTSKKDTRQSLGPFIAVLRSRGFGLVGEAEVRNTMFVRMRFSKCLIPSKGKALLPVGEVHLLENQPRRSLQEVRSSEGLIGPEDEARVLKPCVYKQR